MESSPLIAAGVDGEQFTCPAVSLSTDAGELILSSVMSVYVFGVLVLALVTARLSSVSCLSSAGGGGGGEAALFFLRFFPILCCFIYVANSEVIMFRIEALLKKTVQKFKTREQKDKKKL